MKIANLAELMIRREFLKKNIVLPDKFWNLPKYKTKFAQQMRIASKFFRTYDSEAIWNVIQRETWCFSLAAKKLPDLILEEQEKLKLQKLAAQKSNEQISHSGCEATRYTKQSKNLLDDD